MTFGITTKTVSKESAECHYPKWHYAKGHFALAYWAYCHNPESKDALLN
jgi:hypothetical protein